MLDPAAVELIGQRARQFEGAWVYLELLAEVLGLDDPLALEVVDAYWVGSDLLDQVPPGVVLERLEARFAGQVGGTWRGAVGRARAHHSFQVFEVYPWVAVLLAGLPAGPAVAVLDRCRIRTGSVRSIEGEWLSVTSSVLTWDGAALRPGQPVGERVRWAVDGASLMEAPQVGDLVALHWDWVCDTLSEEQAARIDRLEAAQRAAVGLNELRPR